MSNYLRNVAHRVAGASLLRPRVASRFEPVTGMGPTMSHFREVKTEREVEAPRAREAKETRTTPPPVSPRVSETEVRREESRAPKPAVSIHTSEDHAAARKKADPDLPLPAQQAHTQSDPPPTGNVQSGTTQKPADTRILISQEVTREQIQPRPEPIRRTPQTPPGEAPVAPPFSAPVADRRDPNEKPALSRPVQRVEPPIRNREIPAVLSPVAHAQFAVPQIEITTRDVHVTIGKVTVQATLPAAPVHAPARAVTHNGPRLTLERYLERRGGR